MLHNPFHNFNVSKVLTGKDAEAAERNAAVARDAAAALRGNAAAPDPGANGNFHISFSI